MVHQTFRVIITYCCVVRSYYIALPIRLITFHP